MARRYNAYFTVPTDRQSPSSAANPSISDTPVLSTSSQPGTALPGLQHFRGPHLLSYEKYEEVFGSESTDSRSSQASLEKPRSKSTGTVSPDFQRYRRRPLSFESDENEEVFVGESTDSRSPQASLRKPRSKSLKTALPGFQHFSRPRRLSFNESDANEEVTGTALPGFQHYPRPRRLCFNESDDEINEVGAVEAKSSFSRTSQDSINDDDVRQDVKAMNAVVLDETDANEEVGAIRSKPFDSRFPPSNTSAPIPLESKAPVYNHQRQVCIDFIMNGVETQLNCMVNIRSYDEILYVEPVGLLYEGEKMWRRPVRQVVKEMEKKIAADKNNQK
uniref:Uncharacterized protein n=1 Tax=Panagrolaimus davidi TaxID=227884 RepID=A0A914PU76_9BILA